jgi:hypothetical protein
MLIIILVLTAVAVIVLRETLGNRWEDGKRFSKPSPKALTSGQKTLIVGVITLCIFFLLLAWFVQGVNQITL